MDALSALSTWLRRQGWLVVLIALVQLGLHLWTNAHDNIFRDEMYYLAAAQHLDFGYVEYPPFVALAAAFSRGIFGDSVFAIRLLPGLAAAVVVILTANMAAILGGGWATQALAAVAVALAPVFMGSSGLLTMDPFDQLWWTLAAWVLVGLIKQQEPRRWLIFGVAVGLGLLTKLTMSFFVMALLAGLLLSESRKLLFNRWLIFAGLIAFAIVSPYLVWQALHGFPVIEYTGSYASGKTFQATPLDFLLQQVLTVNPFSLPLWLGGLYFLFFVPAGRPYRAFGWAYLILFVFFMLHKAKFYWLSPSYPVLFAAAAYGLQRWIEQRPRIGWLRPAYSWILSILGMLLVPFSIPILPPETFILLNASVGNAGEVKQEMLVASELPQNYADRYGWREMVAAVRQAYETLAPEEQAEACILTENYGEAGAVDYYGPELGLPGAITGHNSYFLWGPRGCTGEVIISIGRPLRDLSGSFESVEAGPSWSCRYCMPHENGAPIFIARGLQVPMEQAWPSVKAFD